MPVILKLGSRRSLLAMAQSSQIARAIEAGNPDMQVEIVGIDTQGDRVLDVPLSKIEGKEFFVAELDQALIRGEVDLTVHSMKDLSLERPPEITLAAVPPRENPRDVVLFAKDILERLSSGQSIRVGTSSPRRIENVLPFLHRALPQADNTPELTAREIRGNVNTRIGLLALDDADPKRVDAVVLAFAGLKRLWDDEQGRAELTRLTADLRWMVLPLNLCPAAPAQGALAVECRTADDATRKLLGTLHDEQTAADVAAEREILDAWGGGCHQRFGATRVRYPDLGSLLYIKGQKPDGSDVDELRWQSGRQAPAAVVNAWDGTEWREQSFAADYSATPELPEWWHEPTAMFVAHSRALPEGWQCAPESSQRIWTSGTSSWFRLAARGFWVEGCAEEMGYAAVRPLLAEPLLRLPAAADWQVLSHSDAAHTWTEEQVLPTYTVSAVETLSESHPVVAALQGAEAAFWSSASQYEALKDWVPAGCRHACRYGKTYYALLDQGLEVAVYPGVEQWRKAVIK
ncbi:MAG: hydroxymethylbilane synthase [Gammaproteobacteria bacterium]